MTRWLQLLNDAHRRAGAPSTRTLARTSGISHTTIARVLNGYPPRHSTLAAITNAITDNPTTRAAILEAFGLEQTQPHNTPDDDDLITAIHELTTTVRELIAALDKLKENE